MPAGPPLDGGEEAPATGPIFGALDPDQRRRVLAHGEVLRVAPGETVVRQGDRSSAVYVMLSGSAEVLVRGPDEELVEVGALGPGDVFGELAALLEEPRAASVVTDEPAVLFRLDGAQLTAAMADVPPLAIAVARGLARDLAEALGSRTEMQVRTTPGVVEVDAGDAASARSFLRRRSFQALSGMLRGGRLATSGPHPTFTTRLTVTESDLIAWAEALHRSDGPPVPFTAHASSWSALLQRALDHIGADLRTLRHRHVRLSWGPAPMTAGATLDLQLTIEELRPVADTTVALVTQSRLTTGADDVVLVGDDVFTIGGVDRETIRALERAETTDRHHPFEPDALRRLITDGDEPSLPADAEVRSLAVPRDLGARFGRLTGNLDPAHTSAAAARMLGYDRPHLQHLALVNMVLATLVDTRGSAPSRLSLSFLAPVYLGDTVGIRLRGDVVEIVDADDVLQVAGWIGSDAPAPLEGRPPAVDAGEPEQPSPLPEGDPLALRRFLDRRHHDLRERVRELLGDEHWAVPEGIDKASHRELVLERLRDLAREGLTNLAMPAEVGGADDVAAAIAVFETLGFGDLSLLVKYGVQVGLWGGAVLNLGAREHHQAYLSDIASVALPGCFALTELGHGSDARAIRTTLTYDRAHDELVVHTPDVDARKDYIGNAAVHGRMAAVFGQLYVDGECHGVHAAVVPLRDEAGRTLHGVTISDCGHKLGLNGVDNGRLSFDEVRVPRSALLSAHGSISVDGVYSSPIESSGARFFTMLSTLVQGRISVGLAANSASKTALAVAVRYGLGRRQFGPGDGQPETALMDYLTHQRRLLPALATCLALDGALQDLVESHVASRAAPQDTHLRQQVEATAAALKAYATWHATETIQECREACGGAGYLTVNRFADLKADTDVFTTFEGDNTVLLQLVTKTLLSGYAQQFEDMDLGGVVRFVLGRVADAIVPTPPSRATDGEHLRSAAFQLEAMRSREELAVADTARRIKRALDQGRPAYDAFLHYQERVVATGRMHAERLVLESAVANVERCGDLVLAERLDLVRQLHGMARIERDRAWFLEQGLFAPAKARAVSREVNALCTEVRPLAGWLVESLAVPERLLADTIAG
ncbi:MAG TPA: cyclic nucleotide-binding domain-containing protein [Euzebya sp.]|nr:cyclic nucleotide-binding domain-containing protein [Euzebya sp.]